MKTWQKLKNNPGLWDTYLLREKAGKAIRSFFDDLGFHEMEVPILIAHPPAESYLDVFQTTLLSRLKTPTPMYLSTSPETSLKKCLVAGLGNCYCITKSFRNTEVGDDLHTPEFTILEWYRVGASYTDIMSDCEQMFLSLPSLYIQNGILSYQGHSITMNPPWSRLSMKDAFTKFASVDLEDFFDLNRARVIAKNKGYDVSCNNTWEELFNQIFLNEIEPFLGLDRPVFLYDFPGTIAALAKKKPSDPRYAERFELYIGGLELGDCYSELTDWKEQQDRFDAETREMKRLGKTMFQYDRDFIVALKEGLPACAGIAIGVDRLLMLLLNSTSINDTLLFPTQDLL